jgi:hypothetical protein
MNHENHDPRSASCLACQYFFDQEKGSGHCHRFPPVFASNTSPIESHCWKFPLVSGNAWCGEYKAYVETPVAPERATL